MRLQRCEAGPTFLVGRVLFVRRALVHAAAGILLICACACLAAEASIDARVDKVYLALGQGDLTRAADLSATLLNQTSEADPHRAALLQARLDVLWQRKELDQAAANSLRDAIRRYAEQHAIGRSLADRLPIAEALDRGDAQTALKLVEQLLAAPGHRTDEDVAELRTAEARAAVLINGQLDQGRAAARSAIDIWRERRGLRSAWHEAELYDTIGTIDSYTGSKSSALEQFELGSKVAIASFGADSQARIKIDTDRAGVLVDLGRNSDGLAVSEAVLAATRQRYGDHSIEAVKSESMIGAHLQEIGDYPSARERYAHAEAVLTSLPNAPAHDRGLIANNYGNLLQEMGEEDAALEQYRLALEAFGDGEQTTHVRAVVSTGMGNTELRRKHFEAAIADYERALALREKSDGKNNPGIGFTLEGLGSCALALERYADAEQYFRRALEVRSRALPPNHPTLAVLNFGVALANWGQGRLDEAFHYAQITAENQQTMLATFATEFSERQSIAYRQLWTPATALVVTLAAQRGDAESIATAWRLTMVERGLVARTQAHRLAAARAMHDPALAKTWDTWRKANSALGEAWLATDTTAEHMAQLRSESESAERALWERSGHHPADHYQDAGAGSAVEIADLAHALPDDGALIAFTDGVAVDSASSLAVDDDRAPEDWYAFVLGANGQPSLHRIGRVDALTAEAHAWYQELRDPASDQAQLRRHGLALRQALLDRIIGSTSKHHLFIVPEGELFRVSFAALPDDSRGYLIEGATRVHTLAHESDLALPPAPPDSTNALLAGAPDFSVPSPAAVSTQRQLCLRTARQGFAAIPNAARELDDLRGVLSGSTAGSQVKLIVGADATKQNVLAALPRANIVHFATHGFSFNESCGEESGTRGVTLKRESEAAVSGGENAFAISGLAFAGATVARGSNSAGVLSAGELATLDLSHVDWIALSACDSGLGPIGRNEGVFGMRRALRLAGARTVVMSLWQVDDAATADLMESLYRKRFVEHADVPDAMAAAMHSVIAARRAAGQSDHPYYWAAFVSEGGWR
jgi:CHAT domain-containing protein/tetratricopeptide (TPR) repeat protein